MWILFPIHSPASGIRYGIYSAWFISQFDISGQGRGFKERYERMTGRHEIYRRWLTFQALQAMEKEAVLYYTSDFRYLSSGTR